MKFIVHNLRMIWARLSNSGWVLAELFLVFIVMWFLCDSLGCMKYTFYRPLGYDIDHVYRLTTVRGGESRDTTLLDADKYLNILKRLEQEPTVEAASLSYWSLPMSGANSYNSLAVQDTIGVGGRMIYATGGYTRVFHMQEEQGRTFAALPIEPGYCRCFQEAAAGIFAQHTVDMAWRYGEYGYSRWHCRQLPRLSLWR